MHQYGKNNMSTKKKEGKKERREGGKEGERKVTNINFSKLENTYQMINCSRRF